MRFNKCVWPKGEGWRTRSKHKIAMARRAVAKDLESVALFPELAKYKSAEEKMDLQDQMVYGFAESFRAHAAAGWREARKNLKELPPISRAGLLRYWNDPNVWLPRDPAYLLEAIRSVKLGRESYWRRMRIKKQYQLIRDGRLPKSVFQSIKAWNP